MEIEENKYQLQSQINYLEDLLKKNKEYLKNLKLVQQDVGKKLKRQNEKWEILQQNKQQKQNQKNFDFVNQMKGINFYSMEINLGLQRNTKPIQLKLLHQLKNGKNNKGGILQDNKLKDQLEANFFQYLNKKQQKQVQNFVQEINEYDLNLLDTHQDVLYELILNKLPSQKEYLRDFDWIYLKFLLESQFRQKNLGFSVQELFRRFIVQKELDQDGDFLDLDEEQLIQRKKAKEQQQKEIIREKVNMYGKRWNQIMFFVEGKSHMMLSKEWNKDDNLNYDIKRGKWDQWEDIYLIVCMELTQYKQNDFNYSDIKWSDVSDLFQSRNDLQIRERWSNVLSPMLKRKSWSRKEDQNLIELAEIKNWKWSIIAQNNILLNSRTDNECYRRWKYLMGNSYRTEILEDQVIQDKIANKNKFIFNIIPLHSKNIYKEAFNKIISKQRKNKKKKNNFINQNENFNDNLLQENEIIQKKDFLVKQQDSISSP